MSEVPLYAYTFTLTDHNFGTPPVQPRALPAPPPPASRERSAVTALSCSLSVMRPEASQARISPPQDDVGATDRLHCSMSGRYLWEYIIATQFCSIPV